MDPNIIAGDSFGILWNKQTLNKEKYFAKPLVYTSGDLEMVITASSQNWVRIYDAKNGNEVKSRQLTPPFLQSDIGCYDIPDTIGITGTPLIDPDANVMYVLAKGYKGG